MRVTTIFCAVCAVCAALGIAACNSGDGGSETASAPGTIPQPTRAQLAAAGLEKLPLAPKSKRLDITAPKFSDPTRITNPLFPVSRLRSVVFSGRVEGKAFHTETTLLPETRIIEWSPGQEVEAHISQYFAFLDGRIEEVEIKTTDATVDGPRGPVDGAMVARELHDDGTYSDKVFAPGYGEFFTGHGSEVEALALAVPTDALEGAPPAALRALSRAARDAIAAARAGDWEGASREFRSASGAWTAYRREQVPPRIGREMNRALSALRSAIGNRQRARAGTAAIDAAQSALDLTLRYRPPVEIDLRRFELWAEQLLVDASAGDVGGVRSDVTTMEWVRDRFAHGLEPTDLTAIDAHLVPLREAVANEDEDLKTASAEASKLRDPLQLGPVTAP